MKQTQITGSIMVIPADGQDGDHKALVIGDPDSGEILTYELTPEIAQQVARWLKMGNKALHLALAEQQRKMQQAALTEPANEAEARVMAAVRGST